MGVFKKQRKSALTRFTDALHAMGINCILDKGNSKLQTVTI